MIKPPTFDSQTDPQSPVRSPQSEGIPRSALRTPHSEGAPHSELALVPKEDQVTTINSQPSTINLPETRRKIRRNGRIASLPRIQRDMVNRMLWNAVPYKNIVA